MLEVLPVVHYKVTMPYDVVLHRRVLKRLRTTYPKHCQQIVTRLRSLGSVPRPQDCIKLKPLVCTQGCHQA
jgi:hypothetical protein